MGTTGVGYQPRTITREQPTSSGQEQSYSSGCKQIMRVGSEIEFESGSKIDMESGSSFNLLTGAAANLPGTVNLTGTNNMSGTLNLSGSVISTTASANRIAVNTLTTAVGAAFTMRGGVTVITPATQVLAASTAATLNLTQPQKGDFETFIVYNSTYVTELAASTAKAVAFGTVAGKGFALNIAPTTKMKLYGVTVDLVALSTTVIIAKYAKTPIADSTAFVNDPVTVTSATLGA